MCLVMGSSSKKTDGTAADSGGVYGCPGASATSAVPPKPQAVTDTLAALQSLHPSECLDSMTTSTMLSELEESGEEMSEMVSTPAGGEDGNRESVDTSRPSEDSGAADEEGAYGEGPKAPVSTADSLQQPGGNSTEDMQVEEDGELRSPAAPKSSSSCKGSRLEAPVTGSRGRTGGRGAVTTEGLDDEDITGCCESDVSEGLESDDFSTCCMAEDRESLSPGGVFTPSVVEHGDSMSTFQTTSTSCKESWGFYEADADWFSSRCQGQSHAPTSKGSSPSPDAEGLQACLPGETERTSSSRTSSSCSAVSSCQACHSPPCDVLDPSSCLSASATHEESTKALRTQSAASSVVSVVSTRCMMMATREHQEYLVGCEEEVGGGEERSGGDEEEVGHSPSEGVEDVEDESSLPLKDEEEDDEEGYTTSSCSVAPYHHDSPECFPSLPDEDSFSRQETVFIFDWDDTLLPSSWISQKGLSLDSRPYELDTWRLKLTEAAMWAEQTLYTARGLGQVIIVTNAETGWIDLSCHKFMPALAHMLKHFHIVSARSMYESSCCNTPFMWKEAAFFEELQRHFHSDSQRWNVISVGDSTHEREAVFSVCKRLRRMYNVTTKSLKLLEAPAVEELHSQHELMLKCLGPVARHMGNLDLCVTKAAEAQVNPAAAKLPPSLQGSFVGAHTICYHPLSHELIGRA